MFEMYESVEFLTASAAAAYSSHVVGGSVTPACSRMSARYRLPIGPVSCGMRHTPPPAATCFQTHGT